VVATLVIAAKAAFGTGAMYLSRLATAPPDGGFSLDEREKGLLSGIETPEISPTDRPGLTWGASYLEKPLTRWR
jgi:hypothetical protein